MSWFVSVKLARHRCETDNRNDMQMPHLEESGDDEFRPSERESASPVTRVRNGAAIPSATPAGGWLGDQESGCGQSRNRRQTQQRVCCAPPNEISAGNQTRLHKIIPHALPQFGQIKFQAGASNEIKFAPYGRNYSRKSYYSSFGLNMFRWR
jgi:hypothetical protein